MRKPHREDPKKKRRKRGGAVHGGKPHARLDKRARGGQAVAEENNDYVGKSASMPSDPSDKDKLKPAAKDEYTSNARARGGKLTAAKRQSMSKSEFALPGKGDGPKGAGSGSYPIPDKSHARNALARVSQHGSTEQKAAVRRKVHEKFPEIHESG